MERKKHNNPTNKEYYIEKNFLIGRTLFLGGYKFQLLKADEYTEKYMEDNPDLFPEASIENVLRKIKKGYTQYKNLQEYVVALIAFLDKNGDGVISFEEFCNGLNS